MIIIIAASLATHFAFFGHPKETVFDEVHFGKFVSGYFTHEYFFDIHPPLGKLLISAAGWIGGYRPGFSFSEIGQEFGDLTYLWLRFLPTLAGVIFPIVIFFLGRRFSFSNLAAFSAASFIILENSILVQARYILLDQFLLLFGFSSLLFYLRYRQEGKFGSLAIAGLFGALAMSIKWTGATFLALIFIAEAVNLLFKKELGNARSILSVIINLIAVPLVVYVSFFAIHLGLLGKSGPCDAFMSPSFQKSLSGSIYQNDSVIQKKDLWGKIRELNVVMYTANANLKSEHPYSSQWYTWPFMARPIYYWFKASNDAQSPGASRIYFLGNPLIWWASSITVLFAIITALSRGLVFRGEKPLERPTFNILLGGFVLNLLPFLSISRVMFLYHYLAALVFAILMLCYLVDCLRQRKIIFGTLIILSIALFIFFAPLSYGLNLSDKAYELRVWLPSWK